jgi:pyruvate/2-oxoglutarate dehydrogenase complex dihydrolipoamide dehydrogenase (E3) component
VKGGPAFTHISYDDFRILRANLLENGSRTVSDRPIPYTVFTDPQLGRIGLTEKQAQGRDIAYKVAKLPMMSVARARETGQTRGFMKALIDPSTGHILGAAILGAQGGEIAAVIQVAMMGGLPYTALKDGVFAHPTYAESLNNLFMALDE